MKLTLATISFLAATVSSLPAIIEYQTATAIAQETYQPSPYPEQLNSDKSYDSNAPAGAYSSSITDGNGGATPTCTKGRVEQTSVPGGKTHMVKVGGKDYQGAPILKYDPPVVYAGKGDTIVFDFLFRNHTVTESTFDNPCSRKQGDSFASGFRPNPDNTPGTSTFKYTVTDTDTHWAYCGQATHCQAGMVLAINPPKEGNTFEKFLQKAKTATTASDSTNTGSGSTTDNSPSYGSTTDNSPSSGSTTDNSPSYDSDDYSSSAGYSSTTTSCTKSTDYPAPTAYDYSSSTNDYSYSTDTSNVYPDAKGTGCNSSGYLYPTGTGIINPSPTGSGSTRYPSHSQSASYSVQPVSQSSYTVPSYHAPTPYGAN